MCQPLAVTIAPITTAPHPTTTPPPPTASPAVPDPPLLGSIESFLVQVLGDLTPEVHEARPGRPRILPALALWGGLLVCVLRGFAHQRSLWRLLSQHGLWDYPRFPISDQAVYRRLALAGTAPLEQLFVQVSQVLADRIAPYAATDLAPFATEVLVVDETTLDRVARTLPALRPLPPGDDGLLPGKLAGVFDVRRQQWCTLQYHPHARQNEKHTARELLATLPPGSLILADLGYFSFAWFDDLTTRGYPWVSRQRAKTSFRLAHVFYQQGETRDVLVWLGVHRDRAAHLVRLVQYRHGTQLRTYLTNVLDPAVLSLRQVAQLYARRWDIELAFKTVKQHLGLHLMWSAKPVVILQQLWAVLIISQILQALQLEIAARAGVDVFDVSLALLVTEAPRYAAAGRDPVEVFVTQGRAAGYLRPARRIQIQAPYLPPDQLLAAPPELLAARRAPRYTQYTTGSPADRSSSAYAPY